jgi:hypothetical protein
VIDNPAIGADWIAVEDGNYVTRDEVVAKYGDDVAALIEAIRPNELRSRALALFAIKLREAGNQQLYLVAFNDDSGECLDMFISASTPDEALKLFSEHQVVDLSQSSPKVFRVPSVSEKPGVHSWLNPCKLEQGE